MNLITPFSERHQRDSSTKYLVRKSNYSHSIYFPLPESIQYTSKTNYLIITRNKIYSQHTTKSHISVSKIESYNSIKIRFRSNIFPLTNKVKVSFLSEYSWIYVMLHRVGHLVGICIWTLEKIGNCEERQLPAIRTKSVTW